MCFAQPFALFSHLNFQKCSKHAVLCISWFENMLLSTVICHFSTPQLPKVLRAWYALYFLFWKYASLHGDLPFFHAPTSKSAPSMVCFVSLDLKICFAPQWPGYFSTPQTSKSAASMVCFVFLDLKICFAPQWPAIFRTPTSKSAPSMVCFVFLDLKYASRDSDLPFFHAPTSKTAPIVVCFVFLDLKIRFAPQWPAIFPHPNFQKCSEHGALCIS